MRNFDEIKGAVDRFVGMYRDTAVAFKAAIDELDTAIDEVKLTRADRHRIDVAFKSAKDAGYELRNVVGKDWTK